MTTYTYANKSGNSTVWRYYLYPTSPQKIVIRFLYKGIVTQYRYDYNSAGSSTIETMKSLAQSGRGLNSFINKHKPQYYDKDVL